MDLSKKLPREILSEKELRPKRSFGQNFLQRQDVNDRIAQAVLDIAGGKSCEVVEFGAGTGALTGSLLKALCVPVHAVERDRDLVPILLEQFAKPIEEGKLFVHEADAAQVSLESLPKERGVPCVLCGNLPYHLTSTLLLLALVQRAHVQGVVFLLQEEVVERLTARPGSKTYGFLTAVLRLAFRIERLMFVDRSAFWPQPRVDSAVVRLLPEDSGIELISDLPDYIHFVKTVFQKRRKQLKNALVGTCAEGVSLGSLGLSEQVRPEMLSETDFLRLYQVSKKAKQ